MKLATLLISASLLAAPAVAEQCSSKKDAHRVDASYTHTVAGETYTKAKADIVETAAAAGSFSTLLAAAEAAGLVGALKGDGPLTVFAPTDEAFTKLNPKVLEKISEDSALLEQTLLYHVIPSGTMFSEAITDGAIRRTLLNGNNVFFTNNGDGIMVNGNF